MIPGIPTAKLFGGLVGLAAVLIFIGLALSWRTRLEHRDAQLATICAATRDASNQPKLACDQVPQQIGFLGQTVTALSNALKVQSAAVQSLGQQSADQQQKAAQAVQNASGRAKQASDASEGLAASSRAPARSSAPCLPSDKLKEQWK